ncbi:hypothetical protein D9M68_642330 [compost metagenome]
MSLVDSLRGVMYAAPKTEEEKGKRRQVVVLDSAAPGDIVLDSAAEHELIEIRKDAVAAIQQWVEDSDLDDGESSADRLLALMVGIADSNKDGELTDDEQDVVLTALDAAWDYLAAFGADEDDIGALLNDWDGDAAERLRDLVAAGLPEGEDEADAAIDSFAFGDADQEPVLDATYRKRMVIRNGKKMRVNKRVSGAVRLSGKQKLAIRKASLKARSAGAKARRLKSMKLRRKMGL